MSILETIGIDILINIILIKEDVRSAMLIQPVNYNESNGRGEKTKSILDAIKREFPELKQSEDYETYQGIIISKTDYNGKKDISLENMGEILGYPCYKDFNNIGINDTSYEINIYAYLNTGKKIEIFANICKDESQLEIFQKIALKAKEALDKEEYKDLLGDNEVKKIDVEINKNISIQIIIDKLIKNQTINVEDKNKIMNIFYNFGFDTEVQFSFEDNFQYNNPIHKGILLGLLLNEKNYVLSPFIPLEKYPEQSKKVDEIIESWGNDIMKTINETKKKGFFYYFKMKSGFTQKKNTKYKKNISKKIKKIYLKNKKNKKI
jgi:hypothetical protein